MSSQITYRGRSYQCKSGETVLEALERQGLHPDYGCRGGGCHSCIMRLDAGSVPSEATDSLMPAEKQKNYFLPCICEPTSDITIADVADALPLNSSQETAQRFSLKLIRRVKESQEVYRLFFEAKGLSYQAGQFINCYHPDGSSRSYSIASCPSIDSLIELHIQLIPGGKMSNYLIEELVIGSTLEVSSAQGQCIYTSMPVLTPLLMVSTGTGLAPLFGVLKQALNSGHVGPIVLFHGAKTQQGIYLKAELSKLKEQFSNFSYYMAISRGANDAVSPGIAQGRASDFALAHQVRWEGWRAYLCGHPGMIKDLRESLVQRGIAIENVLADAFTLSRK